MSTGNLLKAILYFNTGEYKEGFFAVVMVFANAFLGGCTCSYVVEKFPSKFQSFMVLSVIEIIACFVTGLAMVYTEDVPIFQREFALIALAISNGALLFWGVKLGYSYAVHTLTLLRISEAGYKVFRGISQGGSKLRGDVLTILSILFFFIVGASVGIHVAEKIQFWSLFPLIPLHIFLMIYMYFFTIRLGLVSEEEVRHAKAARKSLFPGKLQLQPSQNHSTSSISKMFSRRQQQQESQDSSSADGSTTENAMHASSPVGISSLPASRGDGHSQDHASRKTPNHQLSPFSSDRDSMMSMDGEMRIFHDMEAWPNSQYDDDGNEYYASREGSFSERDSSSMPSSTSMDATVTTNADNV
jgi:uncharacterized membrane protein YoaK (UPF0700 family)